MFPSEWESVAGWLSDTVDMKATVCKFEGNHKAVDRARDSHGDGVAPRSVNLQATFRWTYKFITDVHLAMF